MGSGAPRGSGVAGGGAEALEQADGHGIAGLLPGELADLGLDRELVGAVAELHERAAEGMAIDCPAHLDQTAGAEERHRLRPYHVGPAALGLALAQDRGEFGVHRLKKWVWGRSRRC